MPKDNIEDFRYKGLNNKRTNTEYAAKRDPLYYKRFGSTIFCSSSLNSWIESVNYSKQMDFYIFGKNADLSVWDNKIKNFEAKR